MANRAKKVECLAKLIEGLKTQRPVTEGSTESVHVGFRRPAAKG